MMASKEDNNIRLSREVGKKEKRKIRGRKEKDKYSVWFGLGMFGLVGWSVAVPALLFTAIGLVIDSSTDGQISWTLTFLVAGVMLECLALDKKGAGR